MNQAAPSEQTRPRGEPRDLQTGITVDLADLTRRLESPPSKRRKRNEEARARGEAFKINLPHNDNLPICWRHQQQPSPTGASSLAEIACAPGKVRHPPT